MKVILAQGNPGNEYANTRHNVGFALLDAFARIHSAEFSEKAKFQADIAEISMSGEKILLVKPRTFYNETGRSARAIVDFYKLSPSDTLVAHDDLALPFGTIRVREKGRDAGNNGIKSLNAHLGEQYTRLRIGINTDVREKMGDAAFVLAKFSTAEQDALDKTILPHARQLIEDFCTERLATTSHVL